MEFEKISREDLDDILKIKRELYDTMIEIANLTVHAHDIDMKIKSRANTIKFIKTDLSNVLRRAVMAKGFDPSVYTVNCEGKVVETDEFDFEKTPVEVPWRK